MHVINNTEPEVDVNSQGEDEYTWYGTDDRGLWITVIGAEIEDGLILIFHVQPDYRRNR